MTRTPPRFATWLLEQLGPGYSSESLSGDLHEQYQYGRSTVWYWWQVLAAIFVNARRIMRVEGPSFATALAAGWLVLWVSQYLTIYTGTVVRHTYRQLTWILGLDHFAYQVASLIAFGLDLIWFGLTWMAQGYVIGRLQGQYRKTAVGLFVVVSTIAPSYWDISHRLANAVQYPTGGWLSAQLMLHIFWVALNAVCVIVGGLWLSRRSHINRLVSST